MLRLLLSLAFLLVAWLQMPGPSAAASELCVAVRAANVRAAPSLQAAILKTKAQGERITVLASANGWWEVALGSGGRAWMHGSVLGACAAAADPLVVLGAETRAQALRYLVEVTTLRSKGSGVLVSADGQDILTAYHVVTAGDSTPAAPLILVRNQADATWRQAEMVQAWPELDLALYRAHQPLTGGVAAPLAASASLPSGSILHALGYPGQGLSVESGPYAGPGGIAGIPSGTFRACVRPGFSGGPAVTSNGEVVGVVLRRTGRQACGARFVQIEAAQRALAALGRATETREAHTATVEGLPLFLAQTEGLMLELSEWSRLVNSAPREHWWDTFCGKGWWNDRALVLEAHAQAAGGDPELKAGLLSTLASLRAMETAKADFCATPDDGGPHLGHEGRWSRFAEGLSALFAQWSALQAQS